MTSILTVKEVASLLKTSRQQVQVHPKLCVNH